MDAARCDGAADCPPRAHCPAGAIFREEEGPYFVGPGCLGCGRCLAFCPLNAIRLV
ncbi:MAG TPA: ferredoxin [Peptococcaceae bacterium]|nr:ferredoxin [Peptococcaceae bacterium]